MPKATKLHSKGKSTSIQKSCKIDKDGSDSTDPEESMRQFQLELCWCIQQLERSLGEKKGNEKQMQESWKVLTVLKNNTQPMIRKRQLMRTHFGDYRGKMAMEEKKLAKMASKMKITETPAQPKATFLRKSAFLTTGDSAFRFNFNLAAEQIDNGKNSSKPVVVEEKPPLNKDGNIVNLDGNTAPIILNNSNTDSGDSKHLGVSAIEDDSKKFKFTFSGSEFKFNFDVLQ